MATIVAAAGGGNWSATGTWTGGVVPTTTDDVQLSGSSGNVTITSGAVCQSLDCTGYTGTLTHTAAVTLTIGSSTAGASNIALKLVAGMTYTLGDAVTSAISFVSTSATTQTIASGGNTLGSWSITGVGNSYQLADGNATGTTATVTLVSGTLNTNGQTCVWGLFNSTNSNTRAFTLGASSITLTGTGTAFTTATATNLTFTKGTSTITLTGASAMLAAGGLSFNNLVFSGSGTQGTSGSMTTVNLTRTGTAVKTDAFSLAFTITVTGTVTLSGNSVTNRLLVLSGTPGTSRIISAATVVVSNADFQDITGAGSGSWNLAAVTGGSGDLGGNNSITFTTPATQTWSGTSGGSWTANAWTSRVPLPQDDVSFNTAFSASQTVVVDMPRLGKNIDWTGATGSPIWSFGINTAAYGSVTLATGMTTSGSGVLSLTGRASYTLTSAGVSYTNALTFTAIGGGYTLQDDLVSGGFLTLNNGGLDANNHNLTIAAFQSLNGNVRTLTMGTGTWTLTASTGNIWSITTAVGLTFSGASSTIVATGLSSGTKTFGGFGLTYGTLSFTVAGLGGTLAITGANTFSTLNVSNLSNARTLTLPAGVTTTITSAFNVFGQLSKLITINSSSSGTAATISKASGNVSADFLSLQDSTAAGGAAWYAGTHSTSVSNVTGWTFTGAPSTASANFALFS